MATAVTMARKENHWTTSIYDAHSSGSTQIRVLGWFREQMVIAADNAHAAGRFESATYLLNLVLTSLAPHAISQHYGDRRTA